MSCLGFLHPRGCQAGFTDPACASLTQPDFTHCFSRGHTLWLSLYTSSLASAERLSCKSNGEQNHPRSSSAVLQDPSTTSGFLLTVAAQETMSKEESVHGWKYFGVTHKERSSELLLSFLYLQGQTQPSRCKFPSQGGSRASGGDRVTQASWKGTALNVS